MVKWYRGVLLCAGGCFRSGFNSRCAKWVTSEHSGRCGSTTASSKTKKRRRTQCSSDFFCAVQFLPGGTTVHKRNPVRLVVREKHPHLISVSEARTNNNRPAGLFYLSPTLALPIMRRGVPWWRATLKSSASNCGQTAENAARTNAPE